MRESTKAALAVLGVLAIAGAFWILLLAPKRDKANELSEQVTSLESEVASEQSKASAALAAQREFPRNYQQLVLTGKAVPAEAATPSLLVQLDGVSAEADTSFQSISLNGAAGQAEPTTTGELAEATEGAASLLPLGASVGPAGLSAMPYSLEFEGGFFAIADFIHGLDSLVKTKDGIVDAHGRLVTIDGFNLVPVASGEGNPASGRLKANFSVTTYVTPPGQGLTAGATPAGPGTEATTEAP